jgi:hypothetical protein
MIRNLVYYCYFENTEINEFTKFNISLLKNYLHVFNGQRIIKIALDDTSKDNSHLLNLFPNCDVEIVQNNKETRESEYFIESIKQIKNLDSITFFGHNKGAKKQENHAYEIMKHWVCSMYFFNLENSFLSEIESKLKTDKTFSGILRITTACPPWVPSDWHYSGTFFWFNTKKLTSIKGWDNFEKGRFSSESYPGRIVNIEQSHTTFVSEGFNFNTYSPSIWNKCLNAQTIGLENFENYKIIFNKIFGEKYTIIIPTLWKSDRTKKLLSDLNECEYVDEIIVINNQLTDILDTKVEKVRHISFGKNIYVNPAWNKGIELAKNECIALCNDDINFNTNIFGVITKDILSEFGIIGQSEFNYKGKNSDEPILEKWNGKVRDWGWGCLIMFDKNNWLDIPDDIKIWYGDDYMFKCNSAPKATLKNFNIETEMSTTSDEHIWNERKEQDKINYIKHLQNATKN